MRARNFICLQGFLLMFTLSGGDAGTGQARDISTPPNNGPAQNLEQGINSEIAEVGNGTTSLTRGQQGTI